MDTSSPAPRLARIVESCEPRFILGAGSVANLLDELMSEDRFRSSVSIGWMGADAAAGRNFEVRFSKDDLESYSGAPLDQQNRREDPARSWPSTATGSRARRYVAPTRLSRAPRLRRTFCGKS